MVNVLAFYADDPSLNPAEVYLQFLMWLTWLIRNEKEANLKVDARAFSFFLPEELQAVWPDWAKFRHLDKLSKIFGKYLVVYLVLDKILICFGKLIIHFKEIWSIERSQIMKNNVTIWTHWLQALTNNVHVSR